jgi:c(7)-type cytochrome triheme protein
VCEAGHAEAALVAPFKGKLAAHYPPYTIDRDFNLGFGHKQHAAAACTDCHAPDTRSRVTPHARCVACHAKTMDRCAGCHPPAIGKPQPPELSALHDTVTTAFSHGKHAQRGAKGRECTTCHAGIRATDDSELPRPTVADCAVAGCHDGKAAFGTTVACVRCHDREPTERFKVSRPTTRFTHGGSHAAIVASAACGTCHPIAGGEVAIAGHAACASCHEEDFGTREPQICGACHYATEPWRHLKPDRGPAERTEFGATLDHGKHTSACASCHSLRTQTAQLRPPRGHRACSTAGCHATTTGPAPHLTDCAGCHRQGLAAAREAARTVAAWSVRAAFDHAAHEHGKDGAAVSCTGCHLDLAARDVVAMPAPPKVTCEPCHDGQTAFSLTGTTCRRCHTPERTR